MAEDFTFPTTAADDSSPSRFLDSPPLWRRSAAKGKEAEDVVDRVFNFPSFQELRASSAKERKCITSSSKDGEFEEEEKMDMLWEDLNDDQIPRKVAAENSDCPRREVQINCVKTLKLSKANGHFISGKKTSILVFIKVLKKVFLMHSPQRAMKKSSW